MDIFGRGGLLDLQDPLTYAGFIPFAGPAIRGAGLLAKGNKLKKAFQAPQTGVPMTGKYGTTQFFNVPGGPLNPLINNPITKNPLKTAALGGVFAPRLFDGQAGPESQANLLNVLDAPQQNISDLNINLNPELPQENPYSLMQKPPSYFDEQFNLVNKTKPETIAPEVITPETKEADETITQEVESVVEKIDPEKLSNKNRQIANMLFALSDVLRGKDPVPGAIQRKQMFEAQEEKRQAKAAQERVGQLIDNLNLPETNKELLKLMPLQTQANILFSSDKEKSANELINQQKLMVLQKLEQEGGDFDQLTNYQQIIFDNFIKSDGDNALTELIELFNPDGNEKLKYKIEPVSQ